MPEGNWIPDLVTALPFASNPGWDFSQPATFGYDCIIPEANLDGTLGFFVATGANSCFIFGSGGNLIIACPGITQLSVPTREVLKDYLDRRVRIAFTLNTLRSDFQVGLWADGDLLVRSGGTAPGGDWGSGTSVQVGGGLVIPSDSIFRYHQRLAPPSSASPRAPRFAQ